MLSYLLLTSYKIPVEIEDNVNITLIPVEIEDNVNITLIIVAG